MYYVGVNFKSNLSSIFGTYTVKYYYRCSKLKYRTVVTVEKIDDSRGNEAVVMKIKLVTDDNNSLKLPLYHIFLEDTKYI
jgi:hypothetical protein